MTARSMAFSPILYRFPGLSRLANRKGPQFRSAPWILASAARQVLYALYTVMPKCLLYNRSQLICSMYSRRHYRHRQLRGTRTGRGPDPEHWLVFTPFDSLLWTKGRGPLILSFGREVGILPADRSLKTKVPGASCRARSGIPDQLRRPAATGSDRPEGTGEGPQSALSACRGHAHRPASPEARLRKRTQLGSAVVHRSPIQSAGGCEEPALEVCASRGACRLARPRRPILS